MTFNHKDVPSVLTEFDNERLLLIDWNVYSKDTNNYIFQDFGRSFYEALNEAITAFKKYRKLVFVYPTFTKHPAESITYFKKFCETQNFKFKIITNPTEFDIIKHEAYISVSDRILGMFLEQCRAKNLEPGTDVGFLSYNETPMKKFIYKGISVVSTNFHELGAQAASFIKNDKPMQIYIPTTLTLRESL